MNEIMNSIIKHHKGFNIMKLIPNRNRIYSSFRTTIAVKSQSLHWINGFVRKYPIEIENPCSDSTSNLVLKLYDGHFTGYGFIVETMSGTDRNKISICNEFDTSTDYDKLIEFLGLIKPIIDEFTPIIYVETSVPRDLDYITDSGIITYDRDLNKFTRYSLERDYEPEDNATEEQIKSMVNKFLSWKLPDDFNPDGGISFYKVANPGTEFEHVRTPVGTNLFTATQAEEMIRFMVQK
jgi:hypothetical protein